MKAFSQLIHSGIVASLALSTLSVVGCATEKEKQEKALKKEKGTAQWYEERQKKKKTVVKDKKERVNAPYTRGQEPRKNPGTGLSIPHVEQD